MSKINASSFFAKGTQYIASQSLRFEDGDSAYLSWTPASAGNRKTWTYSTWIKRGNLGGTQLFGINSGDSWMIRFSTSDKIACNFANDTVTNYFADSTRVFRDTSAWYHIVVSCDTTQSTASDRVKIYVNGELETITGGATTIPQNRDTDINVAAQHRIGAEIGNRYYSDGYLANVAFIDGQALDPTSFGEYDDTLWKPKSDADIQNLTFGTNGFYLNFEDSSAIGDDTSGNANDWTANNLVATDVVLDSPVTGGNFAVLNEVHSISTSVTFSEGNLKAVLPTASSTSRAISTIGVNSGKWYWEASYIADTSDFLQVGVCDPSNFNFRWVIRGNDGESDERPPPSGSSTTASTAVRFGTGDIIGIALDADNGKWYIAVNGTWQLSADFNAGTGYVHDSLSGDLAPVFNNITGSGTQTFIANFGQDSSFAGNATPQGNTDANGVGDFYYAPPSGFLALTTGNLPAATITAPDEYFNTLLWTGDGTSSRALTNVGFQPDFLWTKPRGTLSSSSDNHWLFDVVRGSGASSLLTLASNSTAAEFDGTGSNGNVTSLDADGFTITGGTSTNNNRNKSGVAYVAWNWLAGNGTVSNTDGSITSTVSANQTAGFSVVSYTGTGSAATVGHGLSSAPDLIIVKNRDTARNWTVYNSASGATKFLLLNTTNADQTGTSIWNDTAPTSSVFSVGTSQNVNYAENYIAYCFHSVESYSKIGSYTGNGSSDGTFVHCGFRPAWIMFKRTDSTSTWIIQDAERNQYNVVDKWLDASGSTAEGTLGFLDFTSNGFKHRYTSPTWNTSGGSYIFLAFAEAPFKSANAR